MLSDKFGNPIFQEQDIFNMLYKGQLEYIDQIFAETTVEILELFKNLRIAPKQVDPYEDQQFFDKANQTSWFIPEEITQFPIVEWLYSQCTTEKERIRVDEEITAFIEHGMFDLLFCLKYIVDTLRTNNVVWGVGRGSSVSSYVLYLIGVHKIDSLKYNLDWREFLR
jgi:DNA polymerase III alpha subunit